MTEKLKITRGSGNVFLDIGFTKDEAENLKLRAELMMRIEEFYGKSGMTQSRAAKLLGLTTPRFNAPSFHCLPTFPVRSLLCAASSSSASLSNTSRYELYANDGNGHL